MQELVAHWGDSCEHERKQKTVSIIFARNKRLAANVTLLLAPPPPRQQQRNAGTIMMKISHKKDNHKVCHGWSTRQQRWSQCHFQPVSSTSRATGKAAQTTTGYGFSPTRIFFTASMVVVIPASPLDFKRTKASRFNHHELVTHSFEKGILYSSRYLRMKRNVAIAEHLSTLQEPHGSARD